MTGRGTLDYQPPSQRAVPAWIRRLALWGAVYPLLVLASLYATWGAAWGTLGHRPRPSLDDPKSLGPVVDVFFVTHAAVALGAIPALAAHVIALFVVAALDRPADRRSRRPWLLRLTLSAAAWLVALVVLASDPGRVLYWYLD